MTMTTTTEQDGYRRNAAGHLVPLEMIKPIDLARDALVLEIAELAMALSEAIKVFKGGVFADIEAFVELSVEHYGARRPGGSKGNITLLSFDGRLKVVRAVAENITFDERLQAAKVLIDECLMDWTSEARPELKVLIERAFDTDKQGNIRIGAVLALRRVDIKDERWVRAMQAIGDAVQVVATKAYVRIYQRVGDSERWEPIVLDVAGV